MNKNKFFEKVTGLKPNNEIIQILENLNYKFDFENKKIVDQSLLKIFNNLAEKVSNKETSFFRDEAVFQTIKNQILKDKMKIWSAGCSFGQEAYSLALLWDNILQNKQFEIYATDISKTVIERAQKGNFSIYRKDEKKKNLHFFAFTLKNV